MRRSATLWRNAQSCLVRLQELLIIYYVYIYIYMRMQVCMCLYTCRMYTCMYTCACVVPPHRGSRVPRMHDMIQIISCIRGTRPWPHTTQCLHNKERESARAREFIWNDTRREVRDSQHALYKCHRCKSLADTVCPSLKLPGRPSVYRRSTAAAAVHCLSPHLSH